MIFTDDLFPKSNEVTRKIYSYCFETHFDITQDSFCVRMHLICLHSVFRAHKAYYCMEDDRKYARKFLQQLMVHTTVFVRYVRSLPA